MIMPTYGNSNNNNHSKRRNSSNCDFCFVYLLMTFVLLCIALLVFAIIVIRIRDPNLTINSLSIKSLEYDYSPSFNSSLLATISITNRNYGHLVFDNKQNNNNSVRMLYGSDRIVVGTSKLKFNTSRVSSQGKEDVKVKIDVSSSYNGVILTCEDSTRITKDLEAGKLELMGHTTLKGNVYFLKNILKRPAVALMNCTIGIDLKKQIVKKLQC